MQQARSTAHLQRANLFLMRGLQWLDAAACLFTQRRAELLQNLLLGLPRYTLCRE